MWKYWCFDGVKLNTGKSLAVPRTHGPFSVQFLSFSYSFQQKYCQIISFCPKFRSWHPLSWKSWICHWSRSISVWKSHAHEIFTFFFTSLYSLTTTRCRTRQVLHNVLHHLHTFTICMYFTVVCTYWAAAGLEELRLKHFHSNPSTSCWMKNAGCHPG